MILTAFRVYRIFLMLGHDLFGRGGPETICWLPPPLPWSPSRLLCTTQQYCTNMYLYLYLCLYLYLYLYSPWRLQTCTQLLIRVLNRNGIKLLCTVFLLATLAPPVTDTDRDTLEHDDDCDTDYTLYTYMYMVIVVIKLMGKISAVFDLKFAGSNLQSNFP